jgi:hypothetical protein
MDNARFSKSFPLQKNMSEIFLNINQAKIPEMRNIPDSPLQEPFFIGYAKLSHGCRAEGSVCDFLF